MELSPEILNELLLVCSVITSTASSSNASNDGIVEDDIIPVSDCLNWLQDLQRALRRDGDIYRPISLKLASWKIVEKKLLPLIIYCRYDSAIVLTILKILVILTKPMNSRTKLHIERVNMVEDAVLSEQNKMHNNTLAQNELLIEYKEVFVKFASRKKGNNVLSIFVSQLTEPLKRTGVKRTDSDHMIIELILHLFRNLLSVEPLLKTCSEVTQRGRVLHEHLVFLLEKEIGLEVLLVLSQKLE